MSPGFDLEAVFKDELDKAVADEVAKSGFALEDWFTAGKQRDGHDAVAWWHENGPAMVRAFIDWYEFNPDISIWHTPDGIPAIELPFEIQLGPVPVRGYIDLVLKIGTALVVVDLKTSAKAPVNYRQLAIYACALELQYGVRPRYGTFFMCRGMGRSEPKTYFMRPVELDKPQYSPAYLAGEFGMAETGIKAGVFPAKPGEQCFRCGTAYACTETAGHGAREADPNYPR